MPEFDLKISEQSTIASGDVNTSGDYVPFVVPTAPSGEKNYIAIVDELKDSWGEIGEAGDTGAAGSTTQMDFTENLDFYKYPSKLADSKEMAYNRTLQQRVAAETNGNLTSTPYLSVYPYLLFEIDEDVVDTPGTYFVDLHLPIFYETTESNGDYIVAFEWEIGTGYDSGTVEVGWADNSGTSPYNDYNVERIEELTAYVGPDAIDGGAFNWSSTNKTATEERRLAYRLNGFDEDTRGLMLKLYISRFVYNGE